MDTLPLSQLTAVSPADGRYGKKTAVLRSLFSEYGLFHRRIQVEIAWLNTLLDDRIFPDIPQMSAAARQVLAKLHSGFDMKQAQRIKQIEHTINHDVKAVEYYLAECCRQHPELKALVPIIHFACTSEDINNLAWALILKQARDEELLPMYQNILRRLTTMARNYAAIPMLARTHGQSASPTTVGKEFANVAHRLHRQMEMMSNVCVNGKFNGAVGNFNAHLIAFPDVDWNAMGQKLVNSLDLEYLPYTTQIEPHDYIAELLHAIMRSNVVLIDLCRDIWGYISLGYFCQRVVTEEVGSSTMPHKINPIQFENAEGNFTVANTLADGIAAKLPISRWQRDLSDSTVLRSLGMVFAHTMVALDALEKGLERLNIAEETIAADLDTHWEVLAEAVQTILRKHGCDAAYEQVKIWTRQNRNIGEKEMPQLIESVIGTCPEALHAQLKSELEALSPQTYIGLAPKLTEELCCLLDGRDK